MGRSLFKQSVFPLLTVSGLIFVSAINSSVIVEKVFSLPGLGTLAVTAAFWARIRWVTIS